MKFYKQFTVNYLLNPEKWTRPKVNTERSQMNNIARQYLPGTHAYAV